MFFCGVAELVMVALSMNLCFLPQDVYAQTQLSERSQSILEVNLPPVGTMVPLSDPYAPVLIKGVKVFPEEPFRFDFMVDAGEGKVDDEELRVESSRLIKYFLASLTVPEEDLWVNLSPHEANRVIPEKFGVTEMGRDLLAQDYLLKQITASLMYPEQELGEEFWSRVRERAYAEYGVTDIPVSTFNKVWIVPAESVVYENTETNTAFVVEARLKVMLEEDYLAMANGEEQRAKSLELNNQNAGSHVFNSQPYAHTTELIREIFIPEIEREVNAGANFVQLRQIYHALILATWYKRNLAESILGQVYVGQNKVDGVDIKDKQAKQKIYDQYLESFKVGVYDYIKEDYDPAIQMIVPRQYFSGGFEFSREKMDKSMTVEKKFDQKVWKAMKKGLWGAVFLVAVNLGVTNQSDAFWFTKDNKSGEKNVDSHNTFERWITQLETEPDRSLETLEAFHSLISFVREVSPNMRERIVWAVLSKVDEDLFDVRFEAQEIIIKLMSLRVIDVTLKEKILSRLIDLLKEETAFLNLSIVNFLTNLALEKNIPLDIRSKVINEFIWLLDDSRRVVRSEAYQVLGKISVFPGIHKKKQAKIVAELISAIYAPDSMISSSTGFGVLADVFLGIKGNSKLQEKIKRSMTDYLKKDEAEEKVEVVFALHTVASAKSSSRRLREEIVFNAGRHG